MVAWIAVGLSVVAILIGNILPLFQPRNTDYLNDINSSLTEISEKLTYMQSTAGIKDDYVKIEDDLEEILKSINTIQAGNSKQLRDLLTKS